MSSYHAMFGETTVKLDATQYKEIVSLLTDINNSLLIIITELQRQESFGLVAGNPIPPKKN